jgi:hypothetical protein
MYSYCYVIYFYCYVMCFYYYAMCSFVSLSILIVMYLQGAYTRNHLKPTAVCVLTIHLLVSAEFG